MLIKKEFEDILKLKFPDNEFKALLKNTDEPYFNNKGYNWRQWQIKSEGRLTNAVIHLYKKNQKIEIDYDDHNLIKTSTEQLKKDGYLIVPNFISNEEIDKIKNDALKFDFYNSLDKSKTQHPNKFKSTEDLGPRYASNLDNRDIDISSPLGKILTNKFFGEIAKNYLGVKPYFCSGVYMFSTKIKKSLSINETKTLAQHYHFDFSHFKFLKFFIYLTDVDINSGPHVFVRNSHGENCIFPKNANDFFSYTVHPNGTLDGRINSDFIEKNYAPEDIITMCYPKGTLIIEDTSGMHKGSKILSGSREMLSALYTCSNYGQYNPKTQLTIDTNGKDIDFLRPVSKVWKQRQIENFKKHNKVSQYLKLKRKLSNIFLN